MATPQETALRSAVDAYLSANVGTPGQASAIVFDEAQQVANAAEVAKAPPLPAAFPAAQWTALKTYLTDGGGPTHFDTVFAAVDAALQADQQGVFFRGLLLMYKTVKRNRAGN